MGNLDFSCKWQAYQPTTNLNIPSVFEILLAFLLQKLLCLSLSSLSLSLIKLQLLRLFQVTSFFVTFSRQLPTDSSMFL